ncbi:hypothetical protein HIM_09293 [Hirsutella minnesotensis 3608]|nr:hypothetical protein HIM_09293 [Hirsutella minnesotensis 3608]
MANPPAAQNFLNIPHRLSYVASHTNMAVYAHQNTQLLPRGFREANAGLTIMNDFKTVREIWDACDKIYNSLSHKDQIDWIIQLLPQPKVQQSYAEKRGGNSLGLSDMGKDQIVIWFMPRWKDPSLDIMMAEAQKRFIKDTEAIAKKHGTYSPFVYISYAGPTQNPLCGYGRGSASFLEQVAKKYDPYGVFQRLMRGGFKISQADCG